MPFAERTTTPVAKTRGEIEALVEKYGASKFASGWDGDKAAISFAARGRLLRFTLPLPSAADALALAKKAQRYGWQTPTDAKVQATREMETRRRWRCLLLVLKAKLEVVETGIETFDQAFLANIVTDNNLTVYERVALENSDVKMLTPMEDAP